MADQEEKKTKPEDARSVSAEARVSPPPPDEPEPTRVVYQRPAFGKAQVRVTASPATQKSIWTRELSPAIIPLIVGFLLLLILIGVLGYLSVSRMDDVGGAVLDLEHQHAAKLSLLLKLRLAVTRLDNEARSRAEADARRELKPPFEIRLSAARGELNRLLRELEAPPLASDPIWNQFRNDLIAYVAVTEDLRRYSLEGFGKFDVVDKEVNRLLEEANQQQIEIFHKSETIEQAAAKSIRTWSVIALIFGALVAAGTIWEIQRRFGEMRRSVEEARRERNFTSQLLEGMVSAVAAIDELDRIRSANAAFFRIFPRATIGASIYEKFANDTSMKMLEAATSTRVDGASYRGRWDCPPDENHEQAQTFDVYSSPLAIDGAHGQIVTLVDVTEAAEAERGLRRQESLAAVGQATAQVAHEIRNPLGSIRLGVSMLRDSVNDPEGLHTIELVERGIKHLSKLVVDVAQFSRRKTLEQANVNLNELINHSLNLVADKINDQETKIEKKLADEKLIGHWDFDQLTQVFVNVIANAIDAGPKNSAVAIATEIVNVATGDGDDGATAKSRARVTITDHGSGMDRATLDRIFEPFFSTKKRGTGLGLAIVKQIVEQHEGTITADSEVGKGTTFRIDLPL
ncbi:MAG TPA: ATP-binding protein [Pyrinomonadaceae bacterium]|jgi:signal transduction histidine kinase|nr:ATP-binding protein [Pyrinomonadaceae bacterium]